MKLQFYLRFYTRPGQQLFLSGDAEQLGNLDPLAPVPMSYVNDQFWQLTFDADPAATTKIHYHYRLKNEDGAWVDEWGNDRVVDISKSGIEEIQIIDTWNHAGEFENAFYSAPFEQTLLRHHQYSPKPKHSKTFTHIFKAKAPLLKRDEILCVSGYGSALGDWDASKPLAMTLENNWWTAKANLPKESFPIAYKYGVFDVRKKIFVRFEIGDNRMLYGDAVKKKITILHDGFARLPNNTWRGAGVAIPVFSLRSKTSFGTGEFADIKLLVDWARKTELKLIQILPINDTIATNSFRDSYPYSAISAFALHPLYVNLEKIAGKKHAGMMKSLQKKQRQLNELSEVDYEEVIKFKLAMLRELFAALKDEFLADESYQQFFEQNKHWLVPYAAFSYLRDRNETADFSKWKIYGQYNKAAIEKYVSSKAKHYDAIAVHYFMQYHLHLQLREATDYAHKHGIVLKGDIPIGISRHSCDAWMEPELYHMDQQAGAPPDDFAPKGQNWGFPTYNWQQMSADHFAWWRKRFSQMAEYFDAFRIDHILGFFRIWSIPMDAIEGVMGRFVPARTIHINEFFERNIPFNYQRYARPYINDAILWEFFGQDSDEIKMHYLDSLKDGLYALKPEFNTQRLIVDHLDGLPSDNTHKAFRGGLFNLISNVILFEADDSQGKEFHFRIAIEATSSFRYLQWDTQQQLKALYINYFFERQDEFWRQEAMSKLPALKHSTNMLVCGEDLGMVPGCVPDVMRQLGILSLEIQRMPKNPNEEFFNPATAPYLAVVTPSTHDMSTIRGWWEEDRSTTQRFFNHQLGQWGDAPFFCDAWINKAIVMQHLHSPAMWSIFQLQDLLGTDDALRRENPADERINIPADPEHYWRYRMHINLEELIREKEFNEQLRSAVAASNRNG